MHEDGLDACRKLEEKVVCHFGDFLFLLESNERSNNANLLERLVLLGTSKDR